MAKTPSSKLFKLVKSLSGSEKRYFKLFISTKDKGNNKYAQLFDAIDAQIEFDEEALRHSVYGDEIIETRKYSELKSYLYDLILKSLQSYDEKSSVDYKLKNMLLGVRTLFKRSLFEDCKDILKKAKKLATQYEDFNSLIEVLDWEKKIAYTQTDIAFLDKELDRISEEEKKYLGQLKDISVYRSVFFKMLVTLRKDVSRSEMQKQELTRYINDPIFGDDQKPSSYKSKLLYYRSMSLYHFSNYHLQEFHQTSEKLIALMESNKKMLKEDVSEYISVLNNYIISCGRMKKFDEIEIALNKLKKVEPITADDEVKIHRQYYLNKLKLCITSGEFSEGAMEMKNHLKEARKFDQAQFLKNNFYSYYFNICFGIGDYDEALTWINKWLMLPDSSDMNDLQSLGRLLNLIVNFEVGNMILLESLIRSTERYLKSENRLSALEKRIISFIKSFRQPLSKKEKKEAYKKLRSDLHELSTGQNKGISAFFNFDAWVASKISGKGFAEEVRQKFQQQFKAGK
ncbi:MAG: hypothetical protein AAFZ15_05965 [Bacteroidota bacterium]